MDFSNKDTAESLSNNRLKLAGDKQLPWHFGQVSEILIDKSSGSKGGILVIFNQQQNNNAAINL